MSGAALNSKTWGKSLIYHRKMMNAEYKRGMKRLSFLAEERHIQYRDEYIENVRERIAKNKVFIAEQNKKIKELANRSSHRKNLINMGWDSIKTQLAEEKQKKKDTNKLIFEKTKSLQDRARREWLIEMNDKCTTWNKSPNELKYAKYRLLNKKILERIPRSGNYVLDLNEQPENHQIFESSSVDGYKGPLRSNSHHLANILSKAGSINNITSILKNNNNIGNNTNTNINTEEQLAVDPSSPDYPEYLEFLKYNKERERKRQELIRKRDQKLLSTYHNSLNSENVLNNNTSGIDLDNLTEEFSTFTDMTDLHESNEEYDEDYDEEYDEENDEEYDEENDDDDVNADEDYSFLDKKEKEN
ncbi:hypothetical protein RB653_006380 [Dictyostelium firmibasis]|uniref:Uncharacterized protein n=1 Tax=Dictyostelium firmibasis TaxID=79012 RepID=A0AAN7UMK6_9MYCE